MSALPSKTRHAKMSEVQVTLPPVSHDRLDLLQELLDDPGRHDNALVVVEEDVLLARDVREAGHLRDRVERLIDVGHGPLAADLALRGLQDR